MHWFVFGRAEGVRWDGDEPLWAAVQDCRVVDASPAARAAGVQPGLSEGAASALLPGLAIHAVDAAPSRSVRRLWQAVASFTPRVETIGEDAFCAEWSGAGGRETFEALCAALCAWLSERPRIRGLTVSAAETPGLARALAEWRRIEPVPGIPEQQLGTGGRLLVSPSLQPANRPPAPEDAAWWDGLPVAALWLLPSEVRDALGRFGVFRWAELEALGESVWRRLVPDLPWAWLRRQVCVGQLRVNYPPPVRLQTWTAEAGEACPPAQLPSLLRPLATALWRQLAREGWSARRAGVCWRGAGGEGRAECAAKRTLADEEALYAQFVRLVARVRQPVERLTVFVRDLVPCTGEQLTLGIAGGFPPRLRTVAAGTEAGRLDSLLEQINRRFPGRVRQGLRPGYRELRLQRLEAEAW